jgi:uncharacterized membrane protein YgdD (TMEM256/DUF423 family)
MSKWITIGALLLALGVAAGAFGAHALKDKLDAYSIAIYEKAVLYHLVHALGILVVVAIAQSANLSQRTQNLVCGLLAGGVVVFSGSLYLLAVTGVKWLGAITPIGGTAFIAAWVFLALFR